MSRNAICVWDFTSFSCKDKDDYKDIMESLKTVAKEWAFQLEKTESGQIHAQGRVSLYKKTRKPSNLFDWKAHWSPSSNGVSGWNGKAGSFDTLPGAVKGQMNIDYCVKERTRVAGPFRSTDRTVYIPKQYRTTKMRPFQTAVMALCLAFDDRSINLIYCPFGNKGKSVLAHTMRLKHRAIVLPPLNDGQQIVAAACDICMARGVRSVGAVFIDLPRAMNKERLFGVYTGIEVVKQGWLYDTRYKYKDWDIDSPPVWVFSNHLPDTKLLSNDRWKIWTIDDEYRLVAYKDELDFVEDP